MANEDSNGVLIGLKVHHTNIPSRSKSLLWKIFHGTHSMLGGLCLIGGSCMYFAEINRRYPIALTIGGWLFSMGSFFLLLADLQQCWYNCCLDRKYRDVYELTDNNLFQHSRLLKLDRLKRVETGVHSFVTACGSACYLAGSILLIPTFEKHALVGNWLIIIGSTIIFLCATWKIYHIGYINILNDTSALCIDVYVGLGGAFYFFGVTHSLLTLNTNDFSMNISAALWVVGGTFFFLASIFLQFRYYRIDHQ